MRPDEQPGAPAYLTGQLRAREQSHRRAVLVGMAGLIVFSTSPVFGHHLARQADAFLGGRDHVLQLCLVALHLLLQPVHSAFHLLLLGGLAYAMWDRLRVARRLRGVLALLDWKRAIEGSALERSAQLAGLATIRLRVVDGLPSPAFTAGFWTPCVYVASELATMLDAEQLDAVIAHEAAHVRRRDPLRLSALRFLACTLFYLPALRRLADDAADEAEIAADDDAARQGSLGDRPIVLASALVEIARHWPAFSEEGSRSSLPFVGVVSVGGTDLLDRRVRRLLGAETVVRTHVTRRSLASAGAVLVMVWFSGLMMAHPLPTDVAADQGFMGLELSHSATQPHGVSHDSHCDHRGAFALTHLFCLSGHAHKQGQPCPHATGQAHSLAHRNIG